MNVISMVVKIDTKYEGKLQSIYFLVLDETQK
jgi:hypothetical protein